MADLERVEAFAAVSLDRDELCGDQTLQMPRGRRPRVTEAVGELTGRHRSATSVECDQDVPPMLVRQRAEHRLELVELS